MERGRPQGGETRQETWKFSQVELRQRPVAFPQLVAWRCPGRADWSSTLTRHDDDDGDNDGDDDTDVKREEKRGESRGYILCGMRVGAMP